MTERSIPGRVAWVGASGPRTRRLRRVGKSRGRRAAAAASATPGARRAWKRRLRSLPLSPRRAAAASTCLAKLVADGASAEAVPAPPASGEGCGIDAPVRLSSIMADGGAVSLPDRPLVACEFAAVLADYVRLIVAPLGHTTLHAKVAEIETGPGYDCRTQDRIAGAKISAHAKGLAVDFVAITLADKRRILVERQTARGRSVLLPRDPDGRLRLVHDRSRSRRRRVPRQQHAS